MITNNYKQNKSEVLDIYQQFVSTCKNVEVAVDPSIQLQAEKIQNEVFNLMVLGEAKSGKSSFINAYLGKNILPMDVRQCTSAIIKIHRGEQFKLEAKTAGGEIIVIEGDDNICAFLKEHAAISDKYRNIPITTINNEILIRYGELGKAVPTNVLNDFLKEALKDNICNLNVADYQAQIREYIREMTPSWRNIVTEIDITYPLPEAMQGINIIDTPGIGAGGNLGKITEDYINNANAIIFVKSLNGQALESSSFMNFMRANCREKHKASLFLVFTGKSNLQGFEFASLKQQAIEMYKHDIDPQRIIFVDSKMQLFLNKCNELGTEEKIDAYFDELDQNGNDYEPASKRWLKSKGSIQIFNEKMEEASNFGEVQSSLEKFARVANYVQLVNFLNALDKQCDSYTASISAPLKDAKEHVDDPEVLKDRILQKKAQIDEIFVKMHEGITSIYQKYIDPINGEGILQKEADKMQADYEKRLDFFRSLDENDISNSTFSEMKKATMDAIDNTRQFRCNIGDRLIKECDEKLIQIADDVSKIPVEAYTPNFTETDFDSINETAKKDNSGYRQIEEGVTFTSVRKVPFHHRKNHVLQIADNIYQRLNDQIIPQMLDNAVAYLAECSELYVEKLKGRKNELESEYDKLLELEDNNEAILADIKAREQKIKELSELTVVIKRLKEDLSNYVGR